MGKKRLGVEQIIAKLREAEIHSPKVTRLPKYAGSSRSVSRPTTAGGESTVV
jgi:hypothetical protein